MRLTNEEKSAIRGAILKLDAKARIFLFGSRTDPSLRGGDIDLLVISETLALQDKITLLVDLKEALGDQKIDLVLSTLEESKRNPFVLKAARHAVEL